MVFIFYLIGNLKKEPPQNEEIESDDDDTEVRKSLCLNAVRIKTQMLENDHVNFYSIVKSLTNEKWPDFMNVTLYVV